MKVYLAGPMTGLPDFNFPAFHAAAADLRVRGFDVVNPAELPPDVGTDRPWEIYMRLALAKLLACDAICLLPGWRESRGARLEHEVATALGLERLLYGKQEEAEHEQKD